MPALSPKRQAVLAAEREKNASGDRNFFRLKERKAVMRLAPIADEELIGTRITTYFLNNRPFVCPELSFGTPGVIARTIRALRALGDAKAIEIADGIDGQRRSRFLMKVVVRDKDPLTVQWWEAPKSVYDEIFKAFDDDGEDLAHAKTGRDFRVSSEGKGMTTKYLCRILDPSLLAPTKEERLRLRDESRAMVVRDSVQVNETRALETLQDLIPEKIWAKIEEQVMSGLDLSGKKGHRRRDDDDDDDASPSAGNEDEDDDDEKDDADADDDDEKDDADDDEEDDDDDDEKGDDDDDDAADDDEKGDDDDDDDDDEPPQRPSKKDSSGKGKKMAYVVNDDEDEDERPKPGKSSKVTKEEPKKSSRVTKEEPKKLAKKPGKKPAPSDDDDDEE